MPRQPNPHIDTDPAAVSGGRGDLSYLHPDRLRLGGTGVFAGDWAVTAASDDSPPRVPVGFVGVLIDIWNGWAVFTCAREVAEAIVADQWRLRDAERARLRAQGLRGAALTARLDEAFASMWFDGDDIVVDERATHGDTDGLSRISPDTHGRYVVNGWNWTWTAVDPADCDRIAGRIPPDGEHQEYVVLTHTGMRAPHDRLRVTSLTTCDTHNGEAFVAVLALGGTTVGTIANDGNGGATELYAATSVFDWRPMHAYVAGCRWRGEPMSQGAVLDALVEEHRQDRAVQDAAGQGRRRGPAPRPARARRRRDANQPGAEHHSQPQAPGHRIVGAGRRPPQPALAAVDG
jgi:hypothetical protein